MTNLYDTDFVKWSDRTAQLLKERRWEEIDLKNLIEEVNSLGKSDRRAMRSYLVNLLSHLLKWHYQPQRRSRSWINTIRNARNNMTELIEDSPSLRRYREEVFDQVYQKAREEASFETLLSLEVFPLSCPFSEEEIYEKEYSLAH